MDQPEKTVTLYTANGCYGDYMPWKEDHSIYKNAWSTADHKNVSISSTIEGTPLNSILDTGSTKTVMSLTGQLRPAKPITEFKLVSCPVTGDGFGLSRHLCRYFVRKDSEQ